MKRTRPPPVRTRVYRIWHALLPEMQGEVVHRLDPYSAQALALTSRAAWKQWGDKDTVSSIDVWQDVGWLAHERYVANQWKATAAKGTKYWLCIQEMLLGMAKRADPWLFLVYTDTFVLLGSNDLDDPCIRAMACKAVIQANNPDTLECVINARPSVFCLNNFTRIANLASTLLRADYRHEPNIHMVPLIRQHCVAYGTRWNGFLIQECIAMHEIDFLYRAAAIDTHLAVHMQRKGWLVDDLMIVVYNWGSRLTFRQVYTLQSLVDLMPRVAIDRHAIELIVDQLRAYLIDPVRSSMEHVVVACMEVLEPLAKMEPLFAPLLALRPLK